MFPGFSITGHTYWSFRNPLPPPHPKLSLYRPSPPDHPISPTVGTEHYNDSCFPSSLDNAGPHPHMTFHRRLLPVLQAPPHTHTHLLPRSPQPLEFPPAARSVPDGSPLT